MFDAVVRFVEPFLFRLDDRAARRGAVGDGVRDVVQERIVAAIDFGFAGVRLQRRRNGQHDKQTSLLHGTCPIGVVHTIRTLPPCHETAMKQALHHITVETGSRGLHEVTCEIKRWIDHQHIRTGLLTLFCRHTSASLLIQENADPDVHADLERYFEVVAPESPGRSLCSRRRRPRRYACPPAHRADDRSAFDPRRSRAHGARYHGKAFTCSSTGPRKISANSSCI